MASEEQYERWIQTIMNPTSTTQQRVDAIHAFGAEIKFLPDHEILARIEWLSRRAQEIEGEMSQAEHGNG